VAGVKYVTPEELTNSMANLHKSARMGVVLADKNWDYDKQDIDKYLNELIDAKLIVVEAESMGLDKDPRFVAEENLYILNQSLATLRKEEVIDKVSVTDEDVVRYMNEKIIKEAHGVVDAEEGASKEKEAASPHEPSEFDAARRELFEKRRAVRESEFFDELRSKVSVKIDDALVASIASGAVTAGAGPVATFNGDKITPAQVLNAVVSKEGGDEASVREAVDRLVLHKLIDREALGRNYKDGDGELIMRINTWREEKLVKIFKNTVISPMVVVEDKEISAYYEENLDKLFKMPDRFHFYVIVVPSEEKAKEVVKELADGANFAFMVKNYSIDPRGSAKRGGDLGWMTSHDLSPVIINIAKAAKNGDILGPFSIKGGFAVFRLIEFEETGYATLDMVKAPVKLKLGKEAYARLYIKYVERLRDAVSIEINEKELNKVKSRYGG
jgi:parvulin-like peptidyl-prolyl isomerase